MVITDLWGILFSSASVKSQYDFAHHHFRCSPTKYFSVPYNVPQDIHLIRQFCMVREVKESGKEEVRRKENPRKQHENHISWWPYLRCKGN